VYCTRRYAFPRPCLCFSLSLPISVFPRPSAKLAKEFYRFASKPRFGPHVALSHLQVDDRFLLPFNFAPSSLGASHRKESVWPQIPTVPHKGRESILMNRGRPFFFGSCCPPFLCAVSLIPIRETLCPADRQGRRASGGFLYVLETTWCFLPLPRMLAAKVPGALPVYVGGYRELLLEPTAEQHISDLRPDEILFLHSFLFP